MNLQNLSNTIEDLHAKNNLLRELKHIPKECGTLDVRNNLIETVKVTKCFKNLRDLSILGNYIKDVDTLIYKLNRLEVLSDIIPDEDSSNSESEIDFDNLSENMSENLSDNMSENMSDGSDIDPRLLDEDMLDHEGEVTSDDILNFSKKLKKQKKSKKDKSKKDKLRPSVQVEDKNSKAQSKPKSNQ